MVLNDSGMESYVFPVSGGGGGSAKPEQTKTVNVTENGTQTVTPDTGKVLSSVTINTNVPAPVVPTQEKSVTISQNGASVVTPDTGKYLSKVSITANIPATPTQEKTVSVNANGQTVVTPDSGYTLSKVTVNTNVPTTANKFGSLVDKSITSVTSEDLNNLTSIGLYAFYDCQNLTSITIPASVTAIGDHAIQCGSSTNKVTITMLGSTPPTIQSNTIHYDNVAAIIVPAGSLATYQAASVWTNFSALMVEAEA